MGVNRQRKKGPLREGRENASSSRSLHANRKRRICDSQSLVVGRKPFLELCAHRPEAICKVWVLAGAHFSRDIASRLKLLSGRGVEVEFAQREQLEAISEHGVNQGLVFQVKPRESLPLDRLIGKSLSASGHGLLVALDNVTDPHNLGAVFRAAEASGADGIILTERRSAPISSVVSKTSAGASEFVSCATVGNLSRTLAELKNKGFWIIGTALDEGASSLFEAELLTPSVVVLGSESRGMRRLTRQMCDQVVTIPMQGAIDSLNISQAAAVVLFEFVRRGLGHSTIDPSRSRDR